MEWNRGSPVERPDMFGSITGSRHTLSARLPAQARRRRRSYRPLGGDVLDLGGRDLRDHNGIAGGVGGPALAFWYSWHLGRECLAVSLASFVT